jgi:hypothetical protein
MPGPDVIRAETSEAWHSYQQQGKDVMCTGRWAVGGKAGQPSHNAAPWQKTTKVAGTSSGGDYCLLLLLISLETMYLQDSISGSGGDPTKGTIIAKLIGKFFHDEF